MKIAQFFVIILFGVFIIAGCAETTNEVQSYTSLADYKGTVSECREMINDTALYLANVGAYENNYWKALGFLSDDLAERAFIWLEENSDGTRETVDSAYGEIRQQYKSIALMEVEEKEAEEIHASFLAMYEAYTGLYGLVTAPSGSRSDFTNSLSGYVDVISRSDEDLSLWLD